MKKKIDLIDFDAWDPNNPFRVEFSSNLLQELMQMVKHCQKNEPCTLNILNLTTFIKNFTFIVDLGEPVWGNMSVMTVGSFHVSQKP